MPKSKPKPGAPSARKQEAKGPAPTHEPAFSTKTLDSVLGALRPERKDVVRAFAEEEECEEQGGLTLPKLIMQFGSGSKRWRGTLVNVLSLSTQNVDNGYVLQFNGSALTAPINNVASARGYSTVTTLYGEVFVHSAKYIFQPIQMTGGALINATATNLQDTAVVWCAIQHADSTVSDTSTAFVAAAGFTASKLSSTRARTTFTWRNVEKFTWDGPLADHTTSLASQGWMEAGSVGTKYGGYIIIAGANACNTTPSSTLLPKNLVLGQIIVQYNISCRMRII